MLSGGTAAARGTVRGSPISSAGSTRQSSITGLLKSSAASHRRFPSRGHGSTRPASAADPGFPLFSLPIQKLS